MTNGIEEIVEIAINSEANSFCENIKPLKLVGNPYRISEFVTSFLVEGSLVQDSGFNDIDFLQVSRILHMISFDEGKKFVEFISNNWDAFGDLSNGVRLERIKHASKANIDYFSKQSTLSVYPFPLVDMYPMMSVSSLEEFKTVFNSEGEAGVSKPQPVSIPKLVNAHDFPEIKSTLMKSLWRDFNANSTNKIIPLKPTESISAWILPDVWQTDSPHGLVFSSGGQVFQAGIGPDIFHHTSFCGKTKVPGEKRVIDQAIVVPRIGNNNFYHTLVDRGVHAFAAKHLLNNPSIYWTGKLENMQLQLLELLGLSENNVVSGSDVCKVREGITVAPLTIKDEYYRFMQGYRKSPNPSHSGGRKVYISRADSDYRKLKNTDQLEAAFIDAGFEIFLSKGMSLLEQQAYFRSASIIVGLHGAGLANSMFCPRGIKVIEILNRNYLNGTLGKLAVDCGHFYYPLMVDQAVSDEWEVDIGFLMDQIQQCLDDSVV